MNIHASDLFKGAAWYYARYRAGYPAPLIARIVARFGLDGTGRLLDLGCGTGQLALPLAPYVAEVVGVDPEPEMLAEAALRAQAAGVTNATWLAGSSRDLPALAPRLRPLRLVTMGRSFQWMERDETLAALATLLAPDGGIVITGDGCGLLSDVEPWQQAVRQVIRRWLGEQRRAGSGVWAVPEERFEAALARSPFQHVESNYLRYRRETDIERIIGHLYSTSFCSPAVLGERRAGFERDLRQTLAAINPRGQFAEDVEVGTLFAWRVESRE
jgi:SAM-dependent methyltransferase